MNSAADWIVIGRFGRPQGLKGFIRVVSFASPASFILGYSPWYMRQENQWRAISLLESKVQDKNILVQVTGYVDRAQVAGLTHVEIGILRSQLASLPSGEYYWEDILRMQVCKQDGEQLGTVTDILPTGAHDVLVVNGAERYLIPYVPDLYILSVDVAQKRIIVDWDEPV